MLENYVDHWTSATNLLNDFSTLNEENTRCASVERCEMPILVQSDDPRSSHHTTGCSIDPDHEHWWPHVIDFVDDQSSLLIARTLKIDGAATLARGLDLDAFHSGLSVSSRTPFTIKSDAR
jgi:hypothetical protein